MNNPKKILVLGANAGQLDLIKYMKMLGWHVISCAHRVGEVGERYSDAFHLIDVCDINAIVALAKENKVDLVYSISSDIAMKTAIAVSEKLNLPHFYSSDLFNLLDKKHKLRKHLNDHKISEVGYIEAKNSSQAKDWDSFPCMVKPSDAQGQRGVVKILDKISLEEAILSALALSSSKVAIIEDYLDGVEMSCNVLIQNKKIIFDVLSERAVHEGDLFTIPKAHYIPCQNINENAQIEALNIVHQTVKSLNITDGCLYFQMKATSKGIKIIEIAPRLDGCHMWRLIKEATGHDFLAATIKVLMGEEIKDIQVNLKDNLEYGLFFQQTSPDKRFKIKDFPIPVNTYYHEYRYEDGDKIIPINGRLEVVGYYVSDYG